MFTAYLQWWDRHWWLAIPLVLFAAWDAYTSEKRSREWYQRMMSRHKPSGS